MNKDPKGLPYNYIRSTNFGSCFWCGSETEWIEINFEGYLCFECEEAADRAYWEAVYEGADVDDDF